MWHRLHFWSWTTLVVLLGYILGMLVLQTEQASAPVPQEIFPGDTRRERIPIVHIREIRQGKIHGSVGTGVRLLIGGKAIIPRSDQTFSTEADSFLLNVIDIPIPQGARFVASSRGTNYYPVDAVSGERLVPENRIYFETEREAEAAGYKPGR